MASKIYLTLLDYLVAVTGMDIHSHADTIRDRVIREVRHRALLAKFVAEEERLKRAGDVVLERAEAEKLSRWTRRVLDYCI